MTYPQIDPILFQVGPLALRWYGLAYVLGFLGAALLMRRLNHTWNMGMSGDDMLDVVLAAVVGLVVGARLGYTVFYDFSGFIQNPLSLFAIWDGGMSFHGGLVGILFAGWLISRRVDVPFLRLADMGAVGAPIGLFLGRLGNFVNGELWGRTTDVAWAMVPPYGGTPRHPSQLYEAFLEGIVLFVVMLVLARKRRPNGFQLGVMLTLYGVFRIAVEFVREPDVQLGFILGPFTMGQLLTIPVLAVGAWLVWRTRRGHRSSSAASSDPVDAVEPEGD
ncbi:MAG: prolipoprotein diacylglyceryl transferase [Coriobacteriia bacterium]|nr:prolipoprotein diacylglyceryl transferase [Coriobacteriia bacterium]MBN2823227.1 prolipoprotein diacylglyceryl transferase [Coriobacteriia bacterium]